MNCLKFHITVEQRNLNKIMILGYRIVLPALNLYTTMDKSTEEDSHAPTSGMNCRQSILFLVVNLSLHRFLSNGYW